MSNTIQPSYGAQTYSAPTKARETKQTGTQGSSFMDMAAQASRSRADTFTTGLGGLAGMAAMPTSLMMDLAVRSGGQVQAGGRSAVETPTIYYTRTGTRQRKRWRIGSPPGPIPFTAP